MRKAKYANSKERVNAYSKQLGMPKSNAEYKLKKHIMLNLLFKTKENICYRCNEPIMTIEDLSIDHKKNWINALNAQELFFDMANIGFSHLKCNMIHKTPSACPSRTKYTKGLCKCEECKKASIEYSKNYNKEYYKTNPDKFKKIKTNIQ